MASPCSRSGLRLATSVVPKLALHPCPPSSLLPPPPACRTHVLSLLLARCFPTLCFALPSCPGWKDVGPKVGVRSGTPAPRFWCPGWEREHHQEWGGGPGAEACGGCLFSVPWVVGSHLCLELQVMSHLGRLEIVFLSNVPKEIRSTEMAEIPSELGAEQDTQHSGVGWGKSLTGMEGRTGGSSSLVPPPHTPPGLGLFSQWWFVLVQMGCGKEQG